MTAPGGRTLSGKELLAWGDLDEQRRGRAPAWIAAAAIGIEPKAGSPSDFWRVRAEMFLDTFERYFEWKTPGSAMEL